MIEENQEVNIERLRLDGVFYGYFTKGTLSNGQAITIFFMEERTSRGIEYNVALLIANKKKHIREWIMGTRDVLSDKSTGKCGLEGLMWAKRRLAEFEVYIHDRFPDRTKRSITMVIYPSDTRRKRAYVHGLKKSGYELGYRSSVQCVYKKIA